MKRKVLTILLTLTAALCLCFALAGCDSGGSGTADGEPIPDYTEEKDPDTGDGEHVHDFKNYVYNNDATCTEDGTETGICSCGVADVRTKKGTALDHDLQFHKGVEPTCSEGGTVDYYTCSRCDYQSVEDIYLPALHVRYAYINEHEMEDRCCYVSGVSDECHHSEIEIPKTYWDAEVVTIGDGAFSDCSSLKHITIPDSVHTIAWHSFENCEALERVTISDLSAWCEINFYEMVSNPLYYAHHLYLNDEEITELEIPQGIEYINSYSFCFGAFTSLIIPDSVTYISIYAFAGCDSLTELTVGTGLKEIENAAFGDCPIDTISITDLEAWCNIKCGQTIFGGAQPESEPVYGTLLLNGEPVTDVVIPRSVEELYIGAFGYCESLTSVRFEAGSKLETIDYGAFCGCKNLKSVEIPAHVTLVAEQAFGDCEALEKVIISDLSAWCNIDFGYMGNPLAHAKHLYLGDEELLELAIPDDVTKIKDYVFSGASFTSVTIPGSVTSIGKNAFCECKSLLSLEIQDGVKSIGEQAFAQCEKLEGELVIPESVKEIGASAFDSCRSLSSITIPEGVTKIEQYTFYSCDSLERIVIPSSVTSIEGMAFAYCDLLTDIRYGGTVKEWQAMQNAAEWNNDTSLYTVTCTDGTIDKVGNVTYFAQ